MLPWVLQIFSLFNFLFPKYANLVTSHPDIYEEFQNSNFAVQQSLTNTFRKLVPDKIIERTINKDIKNPGGTTSTSNKGLPYLNANSI